jgi:PAS domain S-box-containing protein
MNIRSPKSLSEELIGGLLVLVSATTLLVTAVHMGFHLWEGQREFAAKKSDYLRFLEEGLRQPLWQLDFETVQKLSESFLKNELAAGLRVVDDRGNRLVDRPPEDPEAPELDRETAVVRQDQDFLGEITIWFTQRHRRAAALELLWGSLTTLAIALLAIVLATRAFVDRFFRRPMAALMARMDAVAQGDFAFPQTAFRHREINDILERFQDMSGRVQQRERKLADVNEALKREIESREALADSLRESERQWHDIVHYAPVGIYQADADGQIRLANPQMAKIFGFGSPEQMMERVDSMESLYRRPRDRADLIRRVHDEGTIFGVEVPFRHQGGRTIWCNLSTRLTRKDGETLFEGFLQDVSERKMFEEALRESERRQAQIINFLPDPTFVVDADGRVIAWNRAMEALTGVAAGQMLGKGDFEYAVPFYGERRPILIDLVRTWNEETALTYSYVRKEGNTLVSETVNPPFQPEDSWFWNAACPLFDDAGRLDGAIETIRDISLLKRTEHSLRESEFKFRSFFNSSPDGVVIIDLDGRIVDINRSILQMTGWEREDLAGRHFEEITADHHHENLRETIESFRKGIAPNAPLEVDYFIRSGARRPAQLRAWLITDQHSRPVAIGAFVKDISREKALAGEKADLEKQLHQTQKMEAIGTLAGGIAHDFNNILAGIVGYAELAQCRLPDGSDQMRGYLQRILEAGNRARDIVQQILQFSREERASHAPVEMAPIVKEAVKLLRATLPPSIEIFESVPSGPAAVLADPTRLHQVVMNLCTNAYHAMRETGGVMHVRLETETVTEIREARGARIAPGPHLKLMVSDTGKGIGPEVSQRIFDPYFTTKKQGEGTGLGLSVTLGIVKNLKGLVEVESEPGAGAAFSVYLPLVQETSPAMEAAALDLPRGRSQHILVVDDEAFFIDSVREHLELLGYRVTADRRSLNALKTFRANPRGFDLILTDQSMPEMTGVQLCARVRMLNPDIPVILCTGYSDQVNQQTAGHFQIDRFLLKPVSRATLARTVAEVLGAPTG